MVDFQQSPNRESSTLRQILRSEALRRASSVFGPRVEGLVQLLKPPTAATAKEKKEKKDKRDKKDKKDKKARSWQL